MVTNTYWYLTAVPELMALAAAKFESRMSPEEVCHACGIFVRSASGLCVSMS